MVLVNYDQLEQLGCMYIIGDGSDGPPWVENTKTGQRGGELKLWGSNEGDDIT